MCPEQNVTYVSERSHTASDPANFALTRMESRCTGCEAGANWYNHYHICASERSHVRTHSDRAP
jgi:hypothetical protein